MTSQQIKEVSFKHFAQHGYEGASLAQIADDVGIKKQSIYTHFKGKDELFLQLCRDACENELRFVLNFIESNSAKPIKEFLLDFLWKYIDRYEKCDSAKFWLRIAFFPPNHLYRQVIKQVYEYLDQLEERLLPIMKKAVEKGEVSPTVGEQRATVAFLALLDGIFVEMIYGSPERLRRRLEASWYLYWRGLSGN
jgi:AcrR family transcriptional regulator